MLNGRGGASLPAIARLPLFAALVAGIIAMHAVTFALGNDHHPQTAMAATSHHQTAAGHPTPAPAPCDGDDCGQHHTGLHGCVFIVTAIAIIAGLTMLCWMGSRNAFLVPLRIRRGPRRRQRAPPWTALTLHQLSILRV